MGKKSKNNQTGDIESRIIRAPDGQLDCTLGLIRKIADEDSPVLLFGPTGTGKELLADYFVEHSPRRNAPYHKINCVGLPEQIIDSELFGHKKGSFTGAIRDHVGLIELSDGGTLFLDEIGILPEVLQAKLLRVLEDNVVRKVGDTSGKSVNVKFIAATNRRINIDLKHRFAFLVETWPLRKRIEDIPFLLRHFLKETKFKLIDLPSLFSTALFDWEGNARQLRNFLKRAEAIRAYEISSGSVDTKNPESSTLSFSLYGFPTENKDEKDQESYSHFSYFGTLSEGYDVTRNMFPAAPDYVKAYDDLRANTNFDQVILGEYPVKKIAFMNWFQDWIDVNDYELVLALNEEFANLAKDILLKYTDALSKEVSKKLKQLIKEPKDDVVYDPIVGTKIRLKEKYLKLENKREKEETQYSLYDLPLKQAQKEFRKRYWQEVHMKNSKLNKKQVAEKMGISETMYHKMKQKFSH